MLAALKSLSIPEDLESDEPLQQPNDQADANNADNGNQSNSRAIAAQELDGRTINNKIRIARLNFMGHVFRSARNGIMHKALSYRIPGKKKVGRPCFTWKSSARQDVDRSGCSLEYWKDIANDKAKFKEATKRLYQEMVESDYEDDDFLETTDSENDIGVSDFEGFSDEEEAIFQGYNEN